MNKQLVIRDIKHTIKDLSGNYQVRLDMTEYLLELRCDTDIITRTVIEMIESFGLQLRHIAIQDNEIVARFNFKLICTKEINKGEYILSSMVTTIKEDLTNKQYGTYDIEQPTGPEDDCVEHDETEDLPAFLEDKYDQPAGPEDEVDDYDEDGIKSVTAEDAFVEVDDSGEAGLMTPSEIASEIASDQAEADDPANYNEEQIAEAQDETAGEDLD